MEKTQIFIGTPVHHLRKDRTRRFSVAFHSYVGLSVGTGCKSLLSRTATVPWLSRLAHLHDILPVLFQTLLQVLENCLPEKALTKRVDHGLQMVPRRFQVKFQANCVANTVDLFFTKAYFKYKFLMDLMVCSVAQAQKHFGGPDDGDTEGWECRVPRPAEMRVWWG